MCLAHYDLEMILVFHLLTDRQLQSFHCTSFQITKAVGGTKIFNQVVGLDFDKKFLIFLTRELLV